MKTIAVLVGSLRSGSFNLKLAKALEKLAEGRLKFVYPDLGSVPHYNDDLWSDLPASVTALKSAIDESDAVLFVTPEYNRTYSPLLANAIAWASRPYGKSSFMHKPGAVVGTSPGAIGTAAGQVDLRGLLPVLGVIPMGQPEVYLQMKPDLIDDASNVTVPDTEAFLKRWVDAFVAFVDRVAL
ncbi:NADPH-dependent FMN reductase [Acuticoccus mangrovi]|uniref:NAD(P)H-dependent oxidoreductase n=1 Tax=Acuticoccus mangrovi TaxID=2796142 RepID=A0A934IKH5_9HYPH|nr:NADPH-dependent FMN reductase [Acuticoccus mangrovi]MBJ3776641.1 NAD(P)H-dependent oxidoreductase [Acuticoccus mangrovi]